jgi:hypothetical protein
MEHTFMPGLLLDSRQHIVIAMLAAESVGVSVRRFDHIPGPEEMVDVAMYEVWITIYRDGEGLFLVKPSDDGEHVEVAPIESFSTAEANESAQFAIELALAHWPDWGSSFRHRFQPRTVIPLPSRLPEA